MSALRPLARPDVIIAPPKSAGRPPRLDFLPLSKLRIDDVYQRPIERRGIATIVRICNEFDWNRFSPLIVAPVPGTDVFAIIDGQHRATAALLLGYEKVPCAIVEAHARDQAAIFTAVNGNVTPVSILQLFKAARAAGTEWAVTLDQVCTAAGLTPLVYPKPKSAIKPFETMAIGTLRRNIARFGAKLVTTALSQAARQPGAGEPGFWNSYAVDGAVMNFRPAQQRPSADGAAAATPMAERIRALKGRGYTRFAIQASLGVKLADIEDALRGEP
jgi:hypothetical protein